MANSLPHSMYILECVFLSETTK